MTSKTNFHPASVRRFRAPAGWSGLLLPVALSAQTSPAPGTSTSSPLADTTGALVALSAEAAAVPVTTVSARDLESTGAQTNLLEALRKLVPQLTGSRNAGVENTGAAAVSTTGGSQLALRNLPTLVLINGRRAASSPMAAAGGPSFADVNAIPLSAIARVDVLSDGASAIYGSDAIGGAVNIVLKSDYQGLEMGVRYGLSDNPGRWTERAVSIAGGASNGTTSITLSAEWVKSDPLFQSERDFSRALHNTTAFPGVISVDAASKNYRPDGKNYYVLNSALAQPPTGHQDLSRLVSLGVYGGPYTSAEVSQFYTGSDYATLLQGNERRSATVSLEHKLAPDLSVFGELLYSRTQTSSQAEPQAITASLAATAAANPSDSAITVHNRLTDYPQAYFNDEQSIRGVAGLRGKLFDDVSWEVAALQHEIRHDYRNTNLIDSAARAAAVANGTLVLTGREQPDGVEKIFGAAYASATSRLTSFDGVIRAKAFELPGGPLQIALAGQIQRESLSLDSDRNSHTDTWNWDGGTKLDPVDHGRSIKSVALELNVPIFGREANVPYARSLSLGFALRRDAYSDVHAPTVPKYTVRWQPFDGQLTLRGSFSRSFAAPSLYQLHGPTSINQSSSLAIAGYDAFGAATGRNITGQAWVRTGANSALAPTTAQNFSTGVAYAPKPIRGLSFTADYFHVNQYNVVGTAGTATILASVEKLGTDSPYASLVRLGKGGYAEGYFDGGTAIADEGKISSVGLSNVFVSDHFVNLGSVKIDGVDLAARYTRAVQNVGQFDLAVTATAYNHYRLRALLDTPYQDLAGTVSSSAGSLPDWRSYTTLGYSRGSLGISLAYTYIPSLRDVEALTTGDSNVASYSQFDLQASYAFGRELAWLGGTRVTLGVENVFNKFGRRSTSYAPSGIDLGTYGAVGRKFYIGLQHKF